MLVIPITLLMLPKIAKPFGLRTGTGNMSNLPPNKSKGLRLETCSIGYGSAGAITLVCKGTSGHGLLTFVLLRCVSCKGTLGGREP